MRNIPKLLRLRLMLWAVAILLSLAEPAGTLAASGAALNGAGSRRALPDWDFDGKRILGHIGHDVYVWDAVTGRVLHKFVGHRERIDSVRFSPDGKYALTSSWINGGPVCSMHLPQFQSKDTSVRLWDLESGKEIWKLDGQLAGNFSPDGKRFVSFSRLGIADPDCGGTDAAVVWDVASGRKIFSVKPEVWPRMAAFSPDNRVLICEVGSDQSAILYNAENGEEIARIPRIQSFNFYGPGDRLEVLTPDGLEIWDSVTGQRIRQIPARIGSDGIRMQVGPRTGIKWLNLRQNVIRPYAMRADAASRSGTSTPER